LRSSAIVAALVARRITRAGPITTNTGISDASDAESGSAAAATGAHDGDERDPAVVDGVHEHCSGGADEDRRTAKAPAARPYATRGLRRSNYIASGGCAILCGWRCW